MSVIPWDLPVGEELRRTEVHARFGGSGQGGISSAPRSGSVLLFTSGAGAEFGYNFDGKQADGSFHYTGEGQVGDQELARGNKAVLQPGRTLRVFEEVRRSVVRYVGEYRLDATRPYYRADAPDRNGELRSVIVFRLWSVSAEAGELSTAEPSGQVEVQSIPVESYQTQRFVANPKKGPTEAERREAALVSRYSEWLGKQDRMTSSREIRLPHQARPLYTDFFDDTEGELIEAKGAASRNHLRLALGQVLDYARYVEHKQLAVLVPVRPADDMITLLASYRVNCIFEAAAGTFDRVDA